jgi:CheY-like chemotaxis protein
MESNANHDLVAEFDQNAADAAIRGAYVLAVDDFSAIRRIIVNCLRQREAYVDEADNGMVAYDKIRMAQTITTPYDLVFLDIEMR